MIFKLTNMARPRDVEELLERGIQRFLFRRLILHGYMVIKRAAKSAKSSRMRRFPIQQAIHFACQRISVALDCQDRGDCRLERLYLTLEGFNVVSMRRYRRAVTLKFSAQRRVFLLLLDQGIRHPANTFAVHMSPDSTPEAILPCCLSTLWFMNGSPVTCTFCRAMIVIPTSHAPHCV